MNRLTSIKHYKKEYVRALYGKLGRESGLNPGVMWPRKEELEHLRQYEAAFCPKLEDLIAESRTKKEALAQARKQREEEVVANLDRLPEDFKKFFKKVEAKEKERQEWVKEREALVEEVREILGFRAKPTDERFQQALEKRAEEEAKAKKKELRKQRDNAGLNELLAATQPEEKGNS